MSVGMSGRSAGAPMNSAPANHRGHALRRSVWQDLVDGSPEATVLSRAGLLPGVSICADELS